MTDIEQETGWVLDVADVEVGTAIVADVPAGGTTIKVNDGGDFPEDGGWLSIAGQVLEYASVQLVDNTRDDIDDDTLDDDVITLTAPLPSGPFPAGIGEGEDVLLWDEVAGATATQVLATVELQTDEDGDDDPLEDVVVDDGVAVTLPRGVREDRGESVVLERSGVGSEWIIRRVIGRSPRVLGSQVDPVDLPPPVAEVPLTAPEPTVGPGPGGLMVTWEPQGPGLEVDLYLSLVESGDVARDALTLHTAGARQPAFIYTMPDNAEVTGARLPADKDVQVSLRVRNAAGAVSAVSSWVPGRAGQIDPENLLLLAGDVIAQRLFGETLAGTRIEGSVLDIFNALYVDQNGASFKGSAELLEATFRGNVTWGGLVNWLLGNLSLASGVPDPTSKPTVGYEWHTPVTTEIESTLSNLVGLCPRIYSLGPTNDVVTLHWTGYVGTGIRTFRKTDGGGIWGFYPDADWTGAFFAYGGITRLGSNYYVLGRDFNTEGDGGPYYVLKLNETFDEVDRWQFAGGASIPGTGQTYTPAIGNDGVNLLIVYSHATDNKSKVQVRTTAGALVGSPVVLAGMGSQAWTGANVDADGTWCLSRKGGSMLGFTTTGARVTAKDMPRAGNTEVVGIYLDGTTWRHLSPDRKLWRYTTHPGGSFDYQWAKYDGDPGGLGLAESKPSPKFTSSAAVRGSRPVVTVPAVDVPATNDSPDRALLYVAPAGGVMRRQWEYPVGQTTKTFDGFTFDSGQAQPKTVSDFASRASGALGTLKSEDVATDTLPLTYIDGKGGGRQLKQRQVGEVSITPAAANTTYDVAVTFLHPFDSTPVVHLDQQGIQNIPAGVDISPINRTANGFTLRYRRNSTVSFTVGWTAHAKTQ